MVILKPEEVDRAQKGQQPGSNLTRSYAASVQRAPFLLQWRGGGSRDALSIAGAARHGPFKGGSQEDGSAGQSALSD